MKSGALDVGLYLDQTGAGARARALYRLSPAAAAYAEAFADRPWGSPWDVGITGGVEVRF